MPHSDFAAFALASSCRALASRNARSSAWVIVMDEAEGPPPPAEPFSKGVRSVAFVEMEVGGRD